MKNSEKSKKKALELFNAVKKSNPDQFREKANQIIPSDASAVSVINNFVDLLKDAVKSDAISNAECLRAINNTIAILGNITNDNHISKEERIKILDVLDNLNKYSTDLQKVRTRWIWGAITAAIMAILVIIVGGGRRPQS